MPINNPLLEVQTFDILNIFYLKPILIFWRAFYPLSAFKMPIFRFFSPPRCLLEKTCSVMQFSKMKRYKILISLLLVNSLVEIYRLLLKEIKQRNATQQHSSTKDQPRGYRSLPPKKCIQRSIPKSLIPYSTVASAISNDCVFRLSRSKPLNHSSPR